MVGGSRCYTVRMGNLSLSQGVLLQPTYLSVSAGASSTCEEEESTCVFKGADVEAAALMMRVLNCS